MKPKKKYETITLELDANTMPILNRMADLADVTLEQLITVLLVQELGRCGDLWKPADTLPSEIPL